MKIRRVLVTLFLALSVSLSWAQSKKGVANDWMAQMLAAKKAISENIPASLPFVSKEFTSKDEPVDVNLDITGVNELVISTWATTDGNDYDHAVWADAVLVDKNGKEYRLQDEKFKVRNVDGGWFRLGTNFSGRPFSIGAKKYTHGVLAHANSLLVVDLKGRDIVRFKSDIGIDNGSATGTAVFKVLPTSGITEAETLAKNVPQSTEVFKLFGINGSDWMTTPGFAAEIGAIKNVAKQLKSSSYIDAELAKIEKLPTELAKFAAYIKLEEEANQIRSIQDQLEWLNVKAIKDAYADFSDAKGYDKAKYQAKMDELLKISNSGFGDIYNNDSKAIANAEKALALKKEILFSNPALDFDKILVTRYGLGRAARSAGAQALGTPPANYSSHMQTRRTGYDSEIIEISNLRGDELKTRTVFSATNGGPIAEPELHWNADKILFTATNEREEFQLYEIGVDGGEAKRLTNVNEDTDLEFFDATYLPSGKIVTASNISYNGVPCVSGADHVSTYSIFDPQTGQLRRLTFDQDCNWSATTLQDGKVMFTRWEYTDLMHYYSRIVFTMNPDGTEQKALVGSGAMFPNSTFDMQQLPENQNRFVGIISGHHGIVRSGRMIIFDPSKARKGVEGMVQEILHRGKPIDDTPRDYLVDGVWPQFIAPQPLTDDYYLVAAKPSPTSLWGIYLVDTFDNMTLISEQEGDGLIWPIPVRKRPVPAVIPETVPMEIARTPQEATVFIQDIYEGEGLEDVPRGTVKEIRVMSYEYAYWNSQSDHMNNGVQSGWEIKRELGRVKVNEDGSALFKIPANTPISLQPLDSIGAAVQLMRSWLTGMPGEVVSCVGCHEDQNTIAKPVRTMASTQKPQELIAPEGGVRPFTFEREIQPILDRACTACHNTESLAGGIDYTKGRKNSYRGKDFIEGRMDSLNAWGQHYWSKSYLSFHPYFYRQGPEAEMAVLNPYEYHVDNSEMIQMLRKGHHGVELTDKEWKTLYTWVDFNLPYDGIQRHNPHHARDGKVYNQYDRRIELSEKYAGNSVKWKEELENYAEYLKKQPVPEPVMPEVKDVEVKNVTARGWPFSPEKAQEMVAGKAPRVIDLGNGQTMTFVYIPAGTFVAGGNGKNGQNLPKRTVIRKGFWMADKEVTNEQMRALVADHDSRYIGQQWKDHTTPGYYVDSNHFAATKISYNDAMMFNKRLADKSGLKITLPTADQWEWAARAGSDNAFWYGDTNADFAEYENLADKSLDKMAVIGVDPQPMSERDAAFRFQAYIPKDRGVNDGNMLVSAPGQYKANPWGLYDINGNVAEWTRSTGSGLNYIVKGGSWYDRAKKITVADNREFLPWHEVWNVGFRPIIEE